MTGTTASAAIPRGGGASPPAPAIITSRPSSSAPFENSCTSPGLLCADAIFTSYGTLNLSSIVEASFITGRSDSLPITIATRGLFIFFHSPLLTLRIRCTQHLFFYLLIYLLIALHSLLITHC